MKILKGIMIFLMCATLLIGYGCSNSKIVNPDPDDQNNGPPPGQQPD